MTSRTNPHSEHPTANPGQRRLNTHHRLHGGETRRRPAVRRQRNVVQTFWSGGAKAHQGRRGCQLELPRRLYPSPSQGPCHVCADGPLVATTPLLLSLLLLLLLPEGRVEQQPTEPSEGCEVGQSGHGVAAVEAQVLKDRA